MITARLMTFSSSRTLPGHGCASMASIASGSSVIAPRRCSAANLRTKPCASSAASPLPIAQRRDLDDDLGQPVVEVFAELALDDLLLEALMRRAHDAHVDRNLLAAADALDDALLQEAQQLRLQRDRQVADLVEEQRAAVGGFDLAERLLDGAR